MSTFKSAPKGRTLPAHPHYLEFERSDGDARFWPTNTTKVVAADGTVNFMRPVPLDEAASVGWRCGIGAGVAKLMNLPDLPREPLLALIFLFLSDRTSIITAGHDYVIKDWPAGYNMYDHNKGPEHRPRHDPYLVGTSARAPSPLLSPRVRRPTDPTQARRTRRASAPCPSSPRTRPGS
jgi:hypothetical protein